MLHISRIFALYLLLFIVSIGYLTFYSAMITLPYVVTLIFLAICFWKIKFLRYILLTILVIALAIVRTNTVNITPDLTMLDDTTWIVVSEPTVSGKTQRFIAQTTRGKNKINIEVTTNQFPDYEFGETVAIDGLINQKGLTNTQISKNISGKFVYPKINRTGFSPLSYINVRKHLIAVKNFFKKNISRSLPEPHAGLINGILLGERAEISDELKTALSRTGTTHIIALSGFNITIVAIFVASLTKGFPRKTSFVLTTLGILCFILATGFSASAIRAGIMGLMLVLAEFLGRESDGLVAILFAGAVMIFANPLILLYDIGFQLSFAAACGIIFLVPILDKWMHFFGKTILKITSPTIAAIIFTWPISSYYFGVFSITALFANILIVPFVEILMFIGFFMAIASSLSHIVTDVISFVGWVITSYIFKVIDFFSKPEWAVMSLKIKSPIFLVGYYLLLFDAILIFGRRKIGKAKTF